MVTIQFQENELQPLLDYLNSEINENRRLLQILKEANPDVEIWDNCFSQKIQLLEPLANKLEFAV